MAMRLVPGFLLTLPFAAFAADVHAQGLERATLEDLLNIRITTATRISEEAGDAPARVQVVTAADIERRGYQSLADLLSDIPDFKVDVGADPDYPTEITVQGMRGSSRIVLLLDGIRISSPTNEPLPILANYPVHSARQVEIVYGPASAVYGADAFSAVINVISRDGADAGGLSVGTSVGQFGLYNQTASYGARLSPNVSLMLAGQFQYDRQPDMRKYYPSDFADFSGHDTGKAAFLVNFARFTTWPADTLPSGQPLTLCVVGDASISDALERAIDGRLVDGHEIAVRVVAASGALRACHVLYASGLDDAAAAPVLRAVEGAPVFTVGESHRFAQSGGVAQLILEGDRMRFAINVTAARRARLTRSSKLLGLARIVRDDSHG